MNLLSLIRFASFSKMERQGSGRNLSKLMCQRGPRIPVLISWRLPSHLIFPFELQYLLYLFLFNKLFKGKVDDLNLFLMPVSFWAFVEDIVYSMLMTVLDIFHLLE